MFLRRRLRRQVALLSGLTSLAIIAVVGPATAAASGSGCEDTYACLWGQPNYEGSKLKLDGGIYGGNGWYQLDFNYNSAKNRYNARKLRLGRYTTQPPLEIHAIACLDPGESRPDPGWFDGFWVSDVTNDECGPG